MRWVALQRVGVPGAAPRLRRPVITRMRAVPAIKSQ